MLRITPSTSAEGAKEYFTQSLTRSDYYIDGQETVGRWGGKAAEPLGLSGEVDAKSYFALCDNLDPNTGEQLTPRNKDNRRVGFDFTFSAPKSVSVLYELSGDERISRCIQSQCQRNHAGNRTRDENARSRQGQVTTTAKREIWCGPSSYISRRAR